MALRSWNDARVEVVSVTVGLAVSDLGAAVAWYRRVLQLPLPDLEPADGVVEFRIGTVWLQLGQEPTPPGAGRTVLRLGVPDVDEQWARLQAMGIAVGALEHVPGAVDFFDFTDPDGNRLSFYTERG